jgi:hypothetical protein
MTMAPSGIAERLRFDPEAAMVIAEPPGTGYGYWAGGAKAWRDPTTGTFALFYRLRSPLEKGRGAECRVAISADGIAFTDVWSATKGDLAATSIEVGHCLSIGGEWRLYVSYEYAATGRWRIDVIRGPEPGALDTQGRRTVLAPDDFGLTWIKDPWVLQRDGSIELFAAVPARTGPEEDGGVVVAGPLDATVVAASDDGLYFPNIEYVFEGTSADTWHARRARLNSAFPIDGTWVATFDGGRTFYDNYEEWAGLAVTDDLRSFTRVDTGGPWVRSPYGSVRYVYGLPVDDAVHFYFEYTRPDGSHDLRVAVVRP